MSNKTFEMSGGHCLWRTPGKETSGPPKCMWHMLPSSLCTDMLEDDPGIFLLGQHYEKNNKRPPCHAWKSVLRMPMHTLAGIIRQLLGFVPASSWRTCSDWPLRSFRTSKQLGDVQ